MKYLVIRDANEIIDGRWFAIYDDVRVLELPNRSIGGINFYPTGKWEQREDGVRAEIYRRASS